MSDKIKETETKMTHGLFIDSPIGEDRSIIVYARAFDEDGTFKMIRLKMFELPLARLNLDMNDVLELMVTIE